MRKLFPLTLAILAAAPAAYSSVVLYSNFGPSGNAYNAGGWVVNNLNHVAMGFNVSSASPLLEIKVPVFWTGPLSGQLPSQPLLIELLGPYPAGQQTPNTPPAVLESWTVNPSGVSGSASVQHLSSLLQPLLDPQQRYFVRMTSAGLPEVFQWAWNINNQGKTGTVFETSNGYGFAPNNASPTLEVLGGDASSVPEPASAVLIGVGLLAGFWRAAAGSLDVHRQR